MNNKLHNHLNNHAHNELDNSSHAAFDDTFFITAPYPAVISHVTFKETPADFLVNEVLDIDFTGVGEHLCVCVKKENTNTNQVASALAKWANIPNKDVSFCGLKDKIAITEQWFSLRIPNQKMPDDTFEFYNEFSKAEIIQTQWHQKKLARGSHRANAFTIRLKQIQGNEQAIIDRLTTIKNEGVPNYFMAQRFGHNGKNLQKALALFTRKRKFKREERSLVLSSARSYLFNHILSERVQAGTWNKALLGDVFNLNGSGSIFTADSIDDEIIKRTAEQDIHPTGALWGNGTLKTSHAMLALENKIAHTHSEFSQGLEAMDLKQARRPLRMQIQDLNWHFEDNNQLVLAFTLPTGGYATAVLACLIAGFIG